MVDPYIMGPSFDRHKHVHCIMVWYGTVCSSVYDCGRGTDATVWSMYNFGKKETHLSSICQGPKQNTHYLGMIIFRKHKPI